MHSTGVSNTSDRSRRVYRPVALNRRRYRTCQSFNGQSLGILSTEPHKPLTEPFVVIIDTSRRSILITTKTSDHTSHIRGPPRGSGPIWSLSPCGARSGEGGRDNASPGLVAMGTKRAGHRLGVYGQTDMQIRRGMG